MPEELRLKIQAGSPKGDKCHWWKGGITPTYKLRRKANLLKNGGHHSRGEWELCKAQYNWTCVLCGKKEPEIKLTKDHIIPVNKGGSNNIENIQPACQPCNSRKNDM
jgi:5-methylcytosine-specific restriction endonuclease McrA